MRAENSTPKSSTHHSQGRVYSHAEGDCGLLTVNSWMVYSCSRLTAFTVVPSHSRGPSSNVRLSRTRSLFPLQHARHHRHSIYGKNDHIREPARPPIQWAVENSVTYTCVDKKVKAVTFALFSLKEFACQATY